jgi:glycosyltransferase involved in cell wall biosynthesis
MADGTRESGDPRLLIIVPAYDEADSIPRVLEDLREHVPEADVVVVDDGSTDNTAEVAESLAAAVLPLPCNLGVGGAMRTGYLYALENGYDLAVQFDGDGQHRADQVRALLASVMEEGVDLAIGSRRLGAGSYRFSLARRVGSRLVAAVAFLVTRLRLTDPTSGFRASSRRMIAFFAKHYPQTYLGDTIESTVLAARHGMKVREIGAEMRQSARSSVGNVMGIFHTVCICLAILVDCIERKFPGYAEPAAPDEESSP